MNCVCEDVPGASESGSSQLDYQKHGGGTSTLIKNRGGGPGHRFGSNGLPKGPESSTSKRGGKQPLLTSTKTAAAAAGL